MELLDKFNELYSKGHPMNEIVENIFLNYNAYTENDTIYFMKKKIAQNFNVEMNCVKLIGSSHTGFKNFKKKEKIKDYDFAIIDPFLYRDYFHKIDITKMDDCTLRKYTNNILMGKIHFLYSNSEINKSVKKKINKIKGELNKEKGINIDKSVTICIYISEKSFINGLTEFFYQRLIEQMKEIRTETEGIKGLNKIN